MLLQRDIYIIYYNIALTGAGSRAFPGERVTLPGAHLSNLPRSWSSSRQKLGVVLFLAIPCPVEAVSSC